MSKLRIILLAVFAGIALTLLGMSVTSIGAGPGDGEVGVILHGAFIMIGLGLALLFGLAAIAAAFWHHKPMRIAALVGLAIVVLIPLVSWIQHEIKILGWEMANDRREAEAIALVARYDALLDTVPRNLETLIRIRRDFRQDQVRHNFGWGSSGSHQWRWKHTLVTRIFADSSYTPAETFGVLDFPSPEACEAFIKRNPAALNTPDRTSIFAEMCPDTPVD